jgi:transposase
MRGSDLQQSAIFSYVSPEQRVPTGHPLREVREITDRVLHKMAGSFGRMYSKTGRPSIAPEKLLRALLLQILYTVRSERMLMEQLDYNVLFRWFVGLNMDDAVWDVTVFTKNRDRLLKAEIARKFFDLVVEEARNLDLMSDEHFTVDGTLLEACAGRKSFKSKDDVDAAPPDDPGNPTVNFHGETRRNDTHQSTTDPQALLARKGGGKEAKRSATAKSSINHSNSNAEGKRNALSITPRLPQFRRSAFENPFRLGLLGTHLWHIQHMDRSPSSPALISRGGQNKRDGAGLLSRDTGATIRDSNGGLVEWGL